MNIRTLKTFLSAFLIVVAVGCSNQDTVSTTSTLEKKSAAGALATPLTSENTECPAGGYLLQTGLDLNGSGDLDPDEVSGTLSLCNHDVGGESLGMVSDEEPGISCVLGGVNADFGIDLNSDGHLSQSEVTRTIHLCHDTSGLASGPLSVVKGKLRNKVATNIVCIGSSSTAGTGASSHEMGYPSQLSRDLTAKYGYDSIQVYNKGIGGETLEHNFARFATDVYPNNPDVVIWQVATTEALAGGNLATFRERLLADCKAVLSRKIELILIEPQYAPDYAATFYPYVQAVRSVAAELKVYDFLRYTDFKNHLAKGEKVIASDKLHPSDLGYTVTAEYLSALL